MITLPARAWSLWPGIRVLPSDGESAPIAAAPDAQNMRQKIKDLALRVLVVDDEPTFRRALRYRLERDYSATVGDVPSGDDALHVDLTSYDVILVDVKMPGMDGIVTCEKMLDRGVKAVIALMSTDSSHLDAANNHRVAFYDKNNPLIALEPILLSAGGGGDL